MATSSKSQKWVCACHRYCNGNPRIVSKSVYYRHFADTNEEDHSRIKASKALSLDAVTLMISTRPQATTSGSGTNREGPIKQANSPEPDGMGLRKHMRGPDKENVPPEVRVLFIVQNNSNIS